MELKIHENGFMWMTKKHANCEISVNAFNEASFKLLHNSSNQSSAKNIIFGGHTSSDFSACRVNFVQQLSAQSTVHSPRVELKVV